MVWWGKRRNKKENLLKQIIESSCSKIKSMKSFLSIILLFSLANCIAQSKIKALCNPIVIGNIPKKALSFNAEIQSNSSNKYKFSTLPTTIGTTTISLVNNIRIGYYKPIVMKPKIFVTLEAGYWFSKFNIDNTNNFFKEVDNTTFHSTTVATTIFKPLNTKNFLLLNASIEANGNAASFKKFGAKNLVAGGAIIYGWKKGVTTMTGVGLLRAYRLGRVVYTPAILWNKNFNKRWGVEMLLPARGFVRYTLKKPTNFLLLGFDLEGTQYAYSGNAISTLNNSFFQRGEIKPRLGIDMQTSKNTRFTANVGCRINGRMDWADNYDGKYLLLENNPTVNLFANVGFHIVSLKAKKK
jgi:hypothetical protein